MAHEMGQPKGSKLKQTSVPDEPIVVGTRHIYTQDFGCRPEFLPIRNYWWCEEGPSRGLKEKFRKVTRLDERLLGSVNTSTRKRDLDLNFL
ncbi:hypothetical protein TNCV_4428021 [Trichonephila clavipes]|nr:hypothetical protein TNCV_4428021 [Trichonephila clavipes]